MAVTLKLTNGKEAKHDADAAWLSGPLFVLSKYNRVRREYETCETFPADQVVWAQYPDGRIVLGRGTVEP